MDQLLVLKKSDFIHFFTALRNFGVVQAPVPVTDQSYAFRPVEHPGAIAFEAIRTILPPKKFLYPQREPVLAYNATSVQQTVPDVEPFVVFGVHPCDLAGIEVMDKIFMSEPGDPYYKARRQKILIVGTSCLPDKYCFCESMGTDTAKGYDIFLTDTGEEFFVQIATAKGSLVLKDAHFLTAPKPEHYTNYKAFWRNRERLFERSFSTKNVPALMDLEKDNPIWNELGDRCLSCGNCTPVCPTCYCFDIMDIAQLNGDGERLREWDSCQFVGFAKVAGDYNFRPGPVDRLKFWYRHKLHGFDDSYQLPTCVGCGRCTVSCPAGIDDIVGTVLRLDGHRVSLQLPETETP